jgi:hypothetical protein
MKGKFVVFFLMTIFAKAVFAGILVTPTIINFVPGDLPRQDLIVINQGPHTAYVNVVPHVILNPGTKSEQRVVIHNPEISGILVAPSKLIIPPKQNAMVRIMQTVQDIKEDKVYRISFIPVPHQLLPGDEQVDRPKAGVRIVFGYGVLVMMRPNDMHYKLIANRIGKLLDIKNTGNTNVVITAGEQCIDPKHCFKLNPHRMYAGNDWQVQLKYALPVKLSTEYMQHVGQIESN